MFSNAVPFYLYVSCLIAAIPPWALMLKPFGIRAQTVGLIIQFAGFCVILADFIYRMQVA